ncbi:hypothetical protein [Enterovibrio paralichthyis]|uniref:hypothetical protein n=1 Tax=Enterovibrio paralichthyis TaxID=2853805 RepID=UPI001C4535D1|nr:hypothetical protein [Enterovibrio paralichthyis]MBV7300249.1 hypothetical protein [Enterovibrio paralichthyis]
MREKLFCAVVVIVAYVLLSLGTTNALLPPISFREGNALALLGTHFLAVTLAALAGTIVGVFNYIVVDMERLRNATVATLRVGLHCVAFLLWWITLQQLAFHRHRPAPIDIKIVNDDIINTYPFIYSMSFNILLLTICIMVIAATHYYYRHQFASNTHWH